MKQLLSAALATAAAVSIATAPASAAATEMLIISGTNPFPWAISYEESIRKIGSGFFPEQHQDSKVVDYPANLWPLSGLRSLTVGQSIEVGLANLHEDIEDADGPVIVAALSSGTMVAYAEQARLADDPGAPAPSQLTFMLAASPMHNSHAVHSSPSARSILSWLPEGPYIPILDVVVTRPVESQYDTIVVVGEYDLVADFPERPWNLLALANAFMAFPLGQDVHGPSSAAKLADVPPENIWVTTNSRDATVTTYLVPTKQLPLTKPLRTIGVPDAVVDALDTVVRPAVDRGYKRHDPAPTPSPFTPGTEAGKGAVIESVEQPRGRERPRLSGHRASNIARPPLFDRVFDRDRHPSQQPRIDVNLDRINDKRLRGLAPDCGKRATPNIDATPSRGGMQPNSNSEPKESSVEGQASTRGSAETRPRPLRGARGTAEH